MNTVKHRIAISLCCLFLGFAWAAAQDFSAPWIYGPQAVEGSQLWFQQQYELKTRPVEARLLVATTGLCDVYLNGRNVSMALTLPPRAEGDTSAIAVELDVRRFMRRGRNVLAVHYSPGRYAKSRRQLALWLSGVDGRGRRFSFKTDSSFYCRLADHEIMENGRERISPLQEDENWRMSLTDLPAWTGVAIYNNKVKGDLRFQTQEEAEARTTRVVRPKYFDVEEDSIWYEFPYAARGRIRITLRDCKPGQEIRVDGLRYRCTGKTDEQIYPRMTASPFRRVLVTGDENFRQEQIQSVEALVEVKKLKD